MLLNHILRAHPTIQHPTMRHRPHHRPHRGQNAPGRAPAIRRTHRRTTWLNPIIERWPPFTSFLLESHIQSQTTLWFLPFGNSRMHRRRRHRSPMVYHCFMGQPLSSNGPCLKPQPQPLPLPQPRRPCQHPRWIPAVRRRRHGWRSKSSINYHPVQSTRKKRKRTK